MIDKLGVDKKRLKCVNCGMVYDVRFHLDIGPEPALRNAKCPKCGSNAYNDVTPIVPTTY